MAKIRVLILLLSASLSLAVFHSSACQAQNEFKFQRNAPSRFLQADDSRVDSTVATNAVPARLASSSSFPSSEWGQDRLGPQGRNVNAETTAYFHTNYNPGRIDAARHTSTQYRLQKSSSEPVVAELLNTNASLVDQWVELADAINGLSGRVVHAQNRLQLARRDFEDVDLKLRQHELTPAIGQLLSHKRNQLDDWQVEGTSGRYISEDIVQTRQRQLENQLLGQDGRDVVGQTREILARSRADAGRSENAGLASQVQSLLRERNEWLQLLKQGYNDYRQKLGDLDSASASLDKLASDYRNLINRHVIWIRSNDPIGIEDAQKAQAGLAAVFNSRRSLDLGYSIRQKWKSNPVSGISLIASIVVVLLVRSFAKSWLLGIGKRKKMRDSTANARKCVASVLTPLVAITIPGVFYLLARWLGTGYVTESTLHSSSGLYAASLVALVVELPRQLLRRFGFVEKHMQIDLPRQQRAGAYLLVIGIGLVLLAYVSTLAGRIDHGVWSGSVSRFGFIASMFLVGWTAHLAFKPKRGFLEPIVEKFGGSVFYRIRVLFYFLGIGLPLAMIILSALGFDFTAAEIVKRAAITLASILIGTTLWAAVKILSSGAWHRLTGTRDQRLDDEYGATETARVSGALAEHSLELKHQMAFLSQCALVLASIVSVGWLWVDIFPNVRLGNPVLWTIEGNATQFSFDVSGQRVSRSQAEATPITLLHVVLAAATLFVAFQVAKLLPSIFDALILQRVNFDEAMEHLSLVLGRCLLFGIGCFVACRLVGIRWETIQWLAVGLSIGLGFGLQDVVKNLLGGMIVLFEKPARLGDLITVGSVTGRVAAQKLRTTTLSDEDGREVIVPNKNFVSHEVINWMGAGRLKAIPMEVVVTRDQRPADVCRMLQHLMVEQPELLLSPAPQATLICVGQQSQRIGLLAWIEEDQDAARYRESLMKVVLNFLMEKNLLAPNQPRQPSLDGSLELQATRVSRQRNRRSA
jgi:potassium-dependent mechanosensitive channel